MNKELVIRIAVDNTVEILKSDELYNKLISKGIYFNRYRSPVIIQTLSGIDYSKDSGYVKAVLEVYRLLGSDESRQYIKKESIKGDIYMVGQYTAQISSYKSDYQFVMRLLNKVQHITLWMLYDRIYELCGGLNIEVLNQKKRLTDILNELFVNVISTDKISEVMQKLGNKLIVSASGKINNFGDNADDWVGRTIQVGHIVVKDKKDFLKLDNEKLENLFLGLTKDQSRYAQQIIMWNETKSLVESKSNGDYTAIFGRHVLMWLIKTIVWGPDKITPLTVFQDYDFYWKHRDRLESLFVMVRNISSGGHGSFILPEQCKENVDQVDEGEVIDDDVVEDEIALQETNVIY